MRQMDDIPSRKVAGQIYITLRARYLLYGNVEGYSAFAMGIGGSTSFLAILASSKLPTNGRLCLSIRNREVVVPIFRALGFSTAARSVSVRKGRRYRVREGYCIFVVERGYMSAVALDQAETCRELARR